MASQSQPAMLWACQSYNTIKIASVNGRYMVKIEIICSEMANNWAQCQAYLTKICFMGSYTNLPCSGLVIVAHRGMIRRNHY